MPKEKRELKEVEAKQAVITPASLKNADGPRKLRIPGFVGSYRDAKFNDLGESLGPVSKETEAQLRRQFPAAEVEVIEE